MHHDKKSHPLDKNNMGISAGLPLQASGESVEELRRNIQQLMDIEAIKQVKHCYFRCIDTANVKELATILHEDVEVHFIGGTYVWELQGREEYISNIAKSFNKHAVGHHNGHHPEIQILSDTEATGIWYLADQMWLLAPKRYTAGTAIYWDRYQKIGDRWLIRETHYQRLYEINNQLQENPQFDSHYLATYGTDVAD